MAVVLPIFVFVSLALIDIQWALERAANLDYIVTETARCQAIAGMSCSGANNPQSYANLLAQDLHMDISSLTVIASGCSSSSCSSTMSYKYKPVGVWFPGITIQRTASAALAAPPAPPNENLP
jgi:hypothetical protein